MSTHLHIERIVIEGLPLTPRDRRALGDAVQRELGLLLRADAAAPWPARDVGVRRVAGDPLTLGAGGAPGGSASRPVGPIGAQIAGAIHGGIGAAVRR